MKSLLKVENLRQLGRGVKSRIRNNDTVRRWMQPYWDWEGRRDRTRLQCRFPELLSYDAVSRRVSAELRPAYEDYIANVSVEGAAISLELGAFLAVLCETTRPTRILDLGSGFSSYVLRSHAARANPRAEVWSVDDDPAWLDRTGEFLRTHDLDTDHLWLWDAFAQQPAGGFDLVLHDLDGFELRAKSLRDVLGLASPRGLVVLDDLHKAFYRAAVAKTLQRWKKERRAPLTFYSARAFTKDRVSIGRYSGLLVGQSPEDGIGQ